MPSSQRELKNPATLRECQHIVHTKKNTFPSLNAYIKIWEQRYAETTLGSQFDAEMPWILEKVFSLDPGSGFIPQCELDEFIRVLDIYYTFAMEFTHEVALLTEDQYDRSLPNKLLNRDVYHVVLNHLRSKSELPKNLREHLDIAIQEYHLRHSSILAPARATTTIGRISATVYQLWEQAKHRDRIINDIRRRNRGNSL